MQRWEAPLYGMTDILVFSTHADEEILFLGGVLTNYGGEQYLNVRGYCPRAKGEKRQKWLEHYVQATFLSI